MIQQCNIIIISGDFNRCLEFEKDESKFNDSRKYKISAIVIKNHKIKIITRNGGISKNVSKRKRNCLRRITLNRGEKLDTENFRNFGL